MSRATTALTLLLAAGLARAAAAQQPQPVLPPDEDRKGVQFMTPPPSVPERTPRRVKVPGPPPSADRDSAGSGGLKGIRALSFEPGRARVLLATGERVLGVGDALEGYVVKAIDSGRLLLAAPGAAAGDVAVVRFDAQGRGRVRIYRTGHDTARPREAK